MHALTKASQIQLPINLPVENGGKVTLRAQRKKIMSKFSK